LARGKCGEVNRGKRIEGMTGLAGRPEEITDESRKSRGVMFNVTQDKEGGDHEQEAFDGNDSGPGGGAADGRHSGGSPQV